MFFILNPSKKTILNKKGIEVYTFGKKNSFFF